MSNENESTYMMRFRNRCGEVDFAEFTADRKYLHELNVLAAIKRPIGCTIISLWSRDIDKTYTETK